MLYFHLHINILKPAIRLMKLSFILIAFSGLFLLSSCRNERKKVDRAKEIIAIENVLEQYIIANEKQDFDLIQQIWSPDSDILLYGTNSDEKLIGFTNIRNAIKEQFTKIKETYISASDQYIKVSECGNTAWFAETLNYNFMYKGEAHSYEGMRFTGVLVKLDGKWRFVQAHLSLPANIDIGD
jgi:ketosteroid isomerase-like protein